MEKYRKIFDYLSLAFNLFFIFQILKVWIAPGAEDGGMIVTIIFMFLFEIVMIHSGVFMTATSSSLGRLLIALCYIPFALIFNYICPSNIMLYIYLFAVFNRMRFAFIKPTRQEKDRELYDSLGVLILWLLTMTVVGILNNIVGIPEFGLNPNYLSTTLINEGTSLQAYLGGFGDEPQIFFCGAIIFYIFIAYKEWKQIHIDGA